jgi:DNA-binding MarR family transcriptional regulator
MALASWNEVGLAAFVNRRRKHHRRRSLKVSLSTIGRNAAGPMFALQFALQQIPRVFRQRKRAAANFHGDT